MVSVNSYNSESLMVPSVLKDPKLIRMAVAAGAELEAESGDGLTPFLKAVVLGAVDSVRQLAACGVDVHACHMPTERNALHLVADAGVNNCELVLALSRLGVDKEAFDHLGITPLIRLVRKHRHVSAYTLVSEGVNVNARDNEGATALHALCAYFHNKTVLELFEALCEAGADVNAQDVAGWTPLHVAAMRGHRDNALCLIGAGARVGLETKRGQTPAQLAREGRLFELAAELTAAARHQHMEVASAETPPPTAPTL